MRFPGLAPWLVVATVATGMMSCRMRDEEAARAAEQDRRRVERQKRIQQAAERARALERIAPVLATSADAAVPADAAIAPTRSASALAAAALREPYSGKADPAMPAAVSYQDWMATPAEQQQRFAPVVNASTAFTLDLLRAVALAPRPPGPAHSPPLVLGGFPLWVTLAMVAQGARGETAEEVRRALHLARDPSVEPVSQEVLDIRKALTADLAEEEVLLRSASGLWAATGVSPEKSFRDRLDALPGVKILNVDLVTRRDLATEAIARWRVTEAGEQHEALRRLHETLENPLPPRAPGAGVPPGHVTLAPEARLAVTQSLTVGGNLGRYWFAKRSRLDPFYLPGCVRLQAPMMHSEPLPEGTLMNKDLGYTIVDIPYGRRLALTLLLPEPPLSVDELLGRLTAAKLRWWFGSLRPIGGITVALPKLDATAQLDLAPALRALGMTRIFKPEADLAGLAASARPLGPVHHQCRFVLQETARRPKVRRYYYGYYDRYGYGRGPLGEDSVESFDRPFLFLLRHRPTGAILVAGIVERPHTLGPSEPGPCKEAPYSNRRLPSNIRPPLKNTHYR